LKSKDSFDTRKLVLLALLSAIVVLLQYLGAFVRVGQFQFALVLVPIVVGASLCGVLAGGWLGAVFGAAVLLNGDAAPFLQINAAAAVAVVLVKGICAGLASGAAYKLLEGKKRFLAVLAAAVVSPIVNTGIFIIGCYAFFLPTLREWGDAWAESVGRAPGNVTAYIFIGLVGINFVLEFIINIALSNAIVRIIEAGRDILSNKR
jgi:uncharacterized membrane protein